MAFKLRSVSKDKVFKSNNILNAVSRDLPDLHDLQEIVQKNEINEEKVFSNSDISKKHSEKNNKKSSKLKNTNIYNKQLLKKYLFPWKFNRIKAIRSETRRISWNIYLIKMRFNNKEIRFNKKSSSLYLKILNQKLSLIICLILLTLILI